MNNNKINKFFASCFGGLIIALYMTAWKNTEFGFALATLLILGVITGMGLVEIAEWGFRKLKPKDNNRIIVSAKRIRIEGVYNMTEVTMVIPNSHKDKMLSALKENFGIDHENIRMMAWENNTHAKFSFVLDRNDMHALKRGLIAMYRTLAGLDKITYN